jgi:hypothetical protein
MAIHSRETFSDGEGMTAMNLFELSSLRPLPRCERCDSTAWATTPGGVRCQEHAVEELEEAIAHQRADWIPRRLRRRRI